MTTNDDDRSERSQVTLRLDRDLLRAIDELAAGQGLDRTELTRRLLADGLAQRRADIALEDYVAGRRSAWSAAEHARVDLYEMLDRIAEAGSTYRIDPDALERLGEPADPVPNREAARNGGPGRSDIGVEDPEIAALRLRYRPAAVRVLFVGESSPAGGTHFYRANSNLFRAIREAMGVGLGIASPPDGTAFLEWFRDLGCWLVDLADHPINRAPPSERSAAVAAGVPGLARLLEDLQPPRVLVVMRPIARAVRRAAELAGLDDRAIDVLPFPVRQWRAVFVAQLAAIVSQDLVSGRKDDQPRRHAIAEARADYGPVRLHEVMTSVLVGRGGGWMKPGVIAREIADRDLWHRPSDGAYPRASQISARARQYPRLFQVSELGIRLRT